MTATRPAPSPASSQPAAAQPASSQPASASSRSSQQQRRPSGLRSTPALVAVTGTVAAGMFLTTLPLSSIFTDWRWFTISVFCALPYLLVVSGFRYRGRPRWWHSGVGLVASVLLLLWVFVPQHLYFGVLPTGGTSHDVRELLNQAGQIMQSGHAPLPSSPPLRLLVAAALVGLTVLTDVLSVLLRQPLLAAAPLLEVLAIASATSSQAANPFWFAAAAIGFLLILLAGTRLQDLAWGPSVDGSAGRLGGGRRMAVTGILAALIVPFLLPAVPTNLLARAAHHNGTGTGPGTGHGQVVLNDLASLRGSLVRPSPVTLFQVHVGDGQEPFYVRQEVDDTFTNDGWRPSGALDSIGIVPLDEHRFPVEPAGVDPNAVPAFQLDATFTVDALGGDTLPVLANPAVLRVTGAGTWNAGTATVSGVKLKRGMVYTESVQQLAPTLEQLRGAPAWNPTVDPAGSRQYLSLPPQPASVTALANQLASSEDTPYDKARAISDYFTNGKNGFTYSLSAPPSDGRSALVTFLDKKVGFCQQYAAAAAVLMRLAGLPTRVVLGYTHRAPDNNGTITVTTSDAHAWVEVFFNGVGWIPFDPTPLGGADLTREVALPWATHPAPSDTSTAEPTANRGQSGVTSGAASSTAAPVVASSGSGIPPLAWQLGLPLLALVLLVAGIGFGPRLVRRRQRRRRFERARAHGDPELLWQELAATATDRNVLWPATATVGQVPAWLGRHGVDERGQAAVTAVARVVERDRFGRGQVREVPPELIRSLDQTLVRWARRTDRRLSLLAKWLPKSLLRRAANWQR